MTLIKKPVFCVLEQFPDRKQVITRLFRENEDFQCLCEDYLQCVEALRHWKGAEEKDAPARRLEYEGLLQELEAEILQNLNEATVCGGS